VAAVARESGLIVGAQVLEELSWEDVQAFVDALPPAHSYCTDQSSIYPDLLWPEGSSHLISQAKELTHTIESLNISQAKELTHTIESLNISQAKELTHTIESLNANLRHYLKRLCRRTRAFSKCIHALRRAVRLFVWYYNRRQRIILARQLSKHDRCAISLYI
jgi:IS1 family transposase